MQAAWARGNQFSSFSRKKKTTSVSKRLSRNGYLSGGGPHRCQPFRLAKVPVGQSARFMGFWQSGGRRWVIHLAKNGISAQPLRGQDSPEVITALCGVRADSYPYQVGGWMEGF
jgi:hypothetical protein